MICNVAKVKGFQTIRDISVAWRRFVSSEGEFHKLQALRRKKLNARDFLKSGIWTSGLWRKV